MVSSNRTQYDAERPDDLPAATSQPGETRDSELLQLITNEATETNLRQLEDVVSHEWPVSAEIRQTVVNRMAEIVETSDDPKNQIAASRVLLSADNANRRTRGPSTTSSNSGGKRTNIAIRMPAGSQIQIYLPDNGRNG